MSNSFFCNLHQWAGNDPNKELQWFSTDNQESYIPSNSIYTPESFTYKFNEANFRCDSFDMTGNSSIMFIGCSFTMGVGLPVEHCWPYLLLDQIKKDTGLSIPYWNLGITASGTDSHVRTIYQYIDKLKPKIIFLLAASARVRDIPTHELISMWGPTYKSNNVPKEAETILCNDHWIKYQVEKNMAFIDLLVQKSGATLIWDQWGRRDKKEYENVLTLPSFKNKVSEQFMTYETKDARDGKHFGYSSNLAYKNSIYSEYKDLILSSL